jgi:hypothetical protein
LVDELLTGSAIPFVFPGIFGGRITFPFDEILNGVTPYAMGDNRFDFVDVCGSVIGRLGHWGKVGGGLCQKVEMDGTAWLKPFRGAEGIESDSKSLNILRVFQAIPGLCQEASDN